jgi:hypothetical protein
VFAPKVGSVWQCDCLAQWRVVSEPAVPAVPAVSGMSRVLKYERVQDRMPSRRAVLDELAAELGPRDDPDAVAVWRAQCSDILAALESRHMARWSARVADQPR